MREVGGWVGDHLSVFFFFFSLAIFNILKTDKFLMLKSSAF